MHSWFRERASSNSRPRTLLKTFRCPIEIHQVTAGIAGFVVNLVELVTVLYEGKLPGHEGNELGEGGIKGQDMSRTLVMMMLWIGDEEVWPGPTTEAVMLMIGRIRTVDGK